MSDDGTGLVFCSSETPSAYCVVITAMHEQTSSQRPRRKDRGKKRESTPEIDAILNKEIAMDYGDTKYSAINCAGSDFV
jgi:hypothetical protein